MTINNLAGAIRDLRKRIPVVVNEATKEVARVIVSTAANNTPVDTTKAISNWQVATGAAPTSVVPAHVPGSGGSTKQASVGIVQDKANAVLQTRKITEDIHITNNAPHIDGLNDGSISKQPGQFVEKAELAGRLQVANTVIRLS